VNKCNDYSIGIELEGADHIPYTPAQYQSLGLLTKELMQNYPRITIGSIVGHNDIAPGRKTDPGIAFDWPRYRQMI
jgi:AmpD protein